MDNIPNSEERIKAIEMAAKLETVQDALNAARDTITAQIGTVEAVIQALMAGGKKV